MALEAHWWLEKDWIGQIGLGKLLVIEIAASIANN